MNKKAGLWWGSPSWWDVSDLLLFVLVLDAQVVHDEGLDVGVLVDDLADGFAVPVAGKNLFHATFRQGELWWHDLLYTIKQVERNGSRAVMWSDKICDGREAFLARMPKDVLLSPWYYGKNFSDKNLAWDKSYEKKTGTWEVQRNLAASFVALNDAGYDLLPCTSNWSCDDAAEAMVSFCKTRLDQKRLKGIYTAPWKMTIPDGEQKKNITKTLEGIDLFAAARDKHCGC